MSPYVTAIHALFAGEDLDPTTARALIAGMLAGNVEPHQIAAVLATLRMKGVTTGELVALAEGMRAEMLTVPVHVDADHPLLDVCGSGASGGVSANVHTLSAFVLAAAGLRVAQQVHGGGERRGGSSDLLEGLGVPVAIEPVRLAALIEQHDLGFLYVPVCHPTLRRVGAVRQALGFQTLFNLLGPLCNPARPDHHVVGVSDPVTAQRIAEALARLGSRRALVTCAADGRDDLSLGAPSRIWMVSGGFVSEGVIEPEELGFERLDRAAMAGGDRATNCAIAEQVLGGDIECPHGQLVALNAGAALWLAEEVDDLPGGVWRAEELLRTGAAGKMLSTYRDAALRAVSR